MASAIAHRGPDDEDVWAEPEIGAVLAHRRLAIVDLSPDGRQPMHSASGRFVLAFNGEFYNFHELRDELERAGAGVKWRGHSDTEVFLAACEHWGIDATLRRTNGMFALAIVDRAERVLVLARDRLGEKPLYYGWQRGTFLFGSELKALRQHPAFEGRIDTAAMLSYFRLGYVPAPHSIYVGIAKLPAATTLRVSLTDKHDRTAVPVAYWTLPQPSGNFTGSTEDAVTQLDTVLREAVRVRLHADVPLGAFLSGGIDSTTIVALMQVQVARPVRTFSIGFAAPEFDETSHARTIAGLLGTQHTELRVTPEDALGVVPGLPQLYDEPFADSSQIPTFLLAKMARQHVTVALSGDGGDELFGGYNRYVQGARVLRLQSFAPGPALRAVARALGAIPDRAWDGMMALSSRNVAVLLGDERLRKLIDVIALDHPAQMYRRFLTHWPDPKALAPQWQEAETVVDKPWQASDNSSQIDWMMRADQALYLPDDILVKVDRATMAVALESRVPFLDPNVVDFAAQLPSGLKIRGGEGKWIVRKLLDRYVERKYLSRPKQGFAVPLAQWLRGPLREWAEDLLSPNALSKAGLERHEAIRSTWEAHKEGRRNFQSRLWIILMYVAWHQHTACSPP
jgi:asparagine synthase (glutamine-hydrolysing)